MDGVRLAYAVQGSGPTLIRAAHWLTHVEHDGRSPVWRHWLTELSRGRRLVRYDGRGCGLSDRSVERLTFDASVEDLEAVADAVQAERFTLLGASQGGPVAIAYAARHPERVARLVLYGTSARGRLRRAATPEERDEAALLQSLVRVGWGRDDAVFRRVFTSRFIPDGTHEQMEWFDRLQRLSASPDVAWRLREAWMRVDVVELLGGIDVPTLVVHVRGDAVIPFEEGRLLAARIQGARLVPLEGRNHILLEGDPGWPRFVEELDAFVGAEPAAYRVTAELSSREVEVLRLVADGATNEQIAARLVLSVRTVERHLSNVYRKLGLSGTSARAAAAARLVELGRR